MKADGTVWAWGLNDEGQLGDGTWNDRLTPVRVSSLTGVLSASAGSNHSLALKNVVSPFVINDIRRALSVSAGLAMPANLGARLMNVNKNVRRIASFQNRTMPGL